jgi:hypothetical protein
MKRSTEMFNSKRDKPHCGVIAKIGGECAGVDWSATSMHDDDGFYFEIVGKMEVNAGEVKPEHEYSELVHMTATRLRAAMQGIIDNLETIEVEAYERPKPESVGVLENLDDILNAIKNRGKRVKE